MTLKKVKRFVIEESWRNVIQPFHRFMWNDIITNGKLWSIITGIATAGATVVMLIMVCQTKRGIETTEKMFEFQYHPVIYVSDVTFEFDKEEKILKRIVLTLENSGFLPALFDYDSIEIYAIAPHIQREEKSLSKNLGGTKLYSKQKLTAHHSCPN